MADSNRVAAAVAAACGLVALAGYLSGCSCTGTAGRAGCSKEVAAARAQLGAAGRAVVIQPVADLLERPGESAAGQPSPLADQALLGDLVLIIEKEKDKDKPSGCTQAGGRFVLVETAAHYRGYLAVAALRPWPEPAPPYRSGALWRVVSRFANVYPQPDLTKSNPLVVLPLGVAIRHERTLDARWVEIALPDGRPGFAQQGDLQRVDSPGTPSFEPSCVVAQALAHEGSPYLWGGRSTYGIDCSGLVANAFAACGVTVPRDAHEQYEWDRMRAAPGPGDPDVLQPADLLFFTSAEIAASGQPRRSMKITHVGVYVGGGRFVHASTSERPTVHQSQIDEAGWQSRWVGSRRYSPSAAASASGPAQN